MNPLAYAEKVVRGSLLNFGARRWLGSQRKSSFRLRT